MIQLESPQEGRLSMHRGRFIHSVPRLTVLAVAGLLIVGCKAGVKGDSVQDAATAMDRPAARDLAREPASLDIAKQGEDAVCAAQSAGADAVPLALYVMMDSTRSMTRTASNGAVKWDSVRTAMSGFFSPTPTRASRSTVKCRSSVADE